MRAAPTLFLLLLLLAPGCRRGGDETRRASGYVEATEVRVAAEVGGRVLEVHAAEGRRVAPGEILVRLDVSDAELALQRARAERDQAAALLRLVRQGPRVEEIRQARAQADSARADEAAAEAELKAALQDLERFEALLAANAGSRKQRDDAATRAAISRARLSAAADRIRAAQQAVARLEAGARREEIAAAEARVASVDAQIAALDKRVADATIEAPVAGTITGKLMDVGETVQPGAPVAVITDLDNAWANVYVDEPLVPLLTLGQPVTLLTDAGHRIPGTISYISPRAEFTPRNVQTADERSKLVYRIKVTVDNKQGILKPGMPVEAELERPRQ